MAKAKSKPEAPKQARRRRRVWRPRSNYARREGTGPDSPRKQGKLAKKDGEETLHKFYSIIDQRWIEYYV